MLMVFQNRGDDKIMRAEIAALATIGVVVVVVVTIDPGFINR